MSAEYCYLGRRSFHHVGQCHMRVKNIFRLTNACARFSKNGFEPLLSPISLSLAWPVSCALLHRHNMDAGGGSSDRERGWFDSGADGAKLGPSAMAGGAPGDAAQSGAETFSTRLCNSLPSPHDERVLLQNQAQGKTPRKTSHTVRCLMKHIQIIVRFTLCFRFFMSCVTRKTCSHPRITIMGWPHIWWTQEPKTSSWRSSWMEEVWISDFIYIILERT